MAEGTEESFLGVAIRDVTRLRKVVATVVAHGFGEFVVRIPMAAQIVGPVLREPSKAPEGAPGERFARLLAALGPTYIKLGQVLSMRSDLLPADYIRALQKLQDQAPPIPYPDVRKVIEDGLGRPAEEIFAEIDETPLATASIGQAHLAKTKSGQKVVVKVQRPGIGSVMRGDLDLLFLAAKALEASIDEMKLVAPSGIIAEFEKSLLRELNFTAELANLVRARQLLDPKRRITVPVPLPEWSCRTVLTMEYFEGVPIRELEPGSERAKKAVEEILHAMCKGVFVDGFFHGDPHAGNIIVGDDGTLCFLDLGLVGTLSPEQRDDLVTLVLGTILDDASTVARVLLKIGHATQRVDIGELKAEITRVRAQYVMVRSVKELDTRGFIEEFANATSKYRVKLATEYSVLVKSAGTIEGLVRRLHPDVDVIPIVRPYVEQVFGDRWSPDKMVQQAVGGATGVVSLLRTMPTHLDQILHDVETGNVQVRPILPKLDALPDRVHDGATRIAVAIFAASMSVCAAIMVPEHLPEQLEDAIYDSFKVLLFLVAFSCALAGWFVTWWWHWLGRGFNLRLSPIFRFFRRG
jgi:ubiquinone biosynthesis protein